MSRRDNELRRYYERRYGRELTDREYGNVLRNGQLRDFNDIPVKDQLIGLAFLGLILLLSLV